MDRIAVLIPCYNEGKTIEKVVLDFKKALPGAAIYVYDNNSTDGTDRIAEKTGAIVRYEYRQGKGNVIRRMFRDIDAECYIITDGDDTYPAEAAVEMVRAVLERNVDMVVGDRLSSTYFKENKRPFHNLGNAMVCGIIHFLFNDSLKDIMTGYRAFSYEFVKTFPVLSNGFEIETEMSVHAIDKNMFAENVTIEYRDRPTGSESKLNTYSDGWKVLRTIVRLYRTYRPMGFFGTVALLMALISTVFFFPVARIFLQTGKVPNFPTLIVCGFTMTAAIQSFFAGLTLQTMLQKNRQDFEMDLRRASENKRKLRREGLSHAVKDSVSLHI